MIVAFARENRLATIVGEKTAGRLLSATSVKVSNGFRLAMPTGAYYTWNGLVLEGTPMEPDELIDFNWRERRSGWTANLNTWSNRFAVITQNESVERAVDTRGGPFPRLAVIRKQHEAGRASFINRMLECSAGASEIMQQSKISPGDMGVSITDVRGP
jgi:hypothetical protein